MGGARGVRRGLLPAAAAAAAAAAAGAAVVAIAAAAGRECPTAIAPEQAPPLSMAALATAAAPAATCGRRLAGTRHQVVCVGGYPVGGYVLEPPRPPTMSLLFLHGLSESPAPVHLAVLARLLRGGGGGGGVGGGGVGGGRAGPRTPPRGEPDDRRNGDRDDDDDGDDDWASVRVLLPLAPRFPRLYVPPDPELGLPAGSVHAWFDISHTLPFQAVGALGGATPADVAASLVATGVVGDRAGLANSAHRIADLVAAQASAEGVGVGLPSVPAHRTGVVGHSLGAAFVWHLAVACRNVPWAGAVALSGYLPLTAYYSRFPEAVPSPGPTRPVGSPPLTLVSVAADGDTVVAPALSAAAADTAQRLAPRTGVRVVHQELRGSDHASYLLGDENTDLVRRLMLDALGARKVGEEERECGGEPKGGTSSLSLRVVKDLFRREGAVCH